MTPVRWSCAVCGVSRVLYVPPDESPVHLCRERLDRIFALEADPPTTKDGPHVS